jgi:hypothetical protein
MHLVIALWGCLHESSHLPHQYSRRKNMAHLNVQAIVSNSATRTGTADPVLVTVSVTRPTGIPVSTLTRSDFIVGNTWASFRIEVEFFQHVGQIGLGAINAAGLYMMRLIPISGSVWTTASPMHLVFVVDTGRDHGQTIEELVFT